MKKKLKKRKFSSNVVAVHAGSSKCLKHDRDVFQQRNTCSSTVNKFFTSSRFYQYFRDGIFKWRVWESRATSLFNRPEFFANYQRTKEENVTKVRARSRSCTSNKEIDERKDGRTNKSFDCFNVFIYCNF